MATFSVMLTKRDACGLIPVDARLARMFWVSEEGDVSPAVPKTPAHFLLLQQLDLQPPAGQQNHCNLSYALETKSVLQRKGQQGNKMAYVIAGPVSVECISLLCADAAAWFAALRIVLVAHACCYYSHSI